MTGTLLTPSHLLILLVVVIVLFGAKRLPGTGRALGSGIREFRDAITAGHGEDADVSADQEDVKRSRELMS